MYYNNQIITVLSADKGKADLPVGALCTAALLVTENSVNLTSITEKVITIGSSVPKRQLCKLVSGVSQTGIFLPQWHVS